MTSPPQLSLLRVLAEHKVDFVLIGGLAVAAHGFERATRDVDIVFDASEGNGERLAAALADLDATTEFADTPPPGDRIESAWLAAGGHFRFGTEAGALDALSAVSGLSYGELASRAIEAELATGTKVAVCAYDDLVTMKEAGGRSRDEDDLRQLRAARGEPDPTA